MNCSGFKVNMSCKIIADTSVLINLNASGYRDIIFREFTGRMYTTNIVYDELQRGESRKGYHDAAIIKDFEKKGIIKIVSLSEESQNIFKNLVYGSAPQTLDDGEASVIAYAYISDGIALIDEKKATKICKLEYPNLKICNTIDFLRQKRFLQKFGNKMIMESIINAKNNARMPIPYYFMKVLESFEKMEDLLLEGSDNL